MASLVIWMITLTISLAAIILSAAAGQPNIHTAVAALIGLSIAGMAVGENRQQRKAGVQENIVAATTARAMGLVWVWGALSLFVTYYFILSWKEWLVFTGVFALVGILCMFFAATLERDAESGRKDETMLNLAKYLSIGQWVGMLIAMLGLIIDGKFPVTVGKNIGWQDWAANNIFFFGALSIAIITANALWTKHKNEQGNGNVAGHGA
ncbi:MAG: hypothetical protein K0U74_10440 [Alphaproteobacteria bacterium]|nr:hypothetical protein [Alphaproteobacteria bacterium]